MQFMLDGKLRFVSRDGASAAKPQVWLKSEEEEIILDIQDDPSNEEESCEIDFDTVLCQLELNERSDLNISSIMNQQSDNEVGDNL